MNMRFFPCWTLPALMLAVSQTASAARDNDLEDLRQGSADPTEWQVIKKDKRHGITAWGRREEGKSLRSFKIEYEVEGTLNDIARVTFDLPNYNRWYYQLKEARLLKRVSDREFYWYIVHKAPATLPDRDAVLRSTITPYSPKTGYAMMKIESVPDYLPPKPPYVRMVAENMTVKWSPAGNNRWQNVSEGFIDPGGSAPDWATNFVQRMAPYQTVLGLQRMIQS
ncbi:MAG TPA: hypothetical protein VFW49_13885, partial [Fluviicoccus sp.]|nr:hypothetical protein [Fluviicoccus sp.]